MKSLFCFLICLNFLNAQVVTGHLVYKKCCESPLEEVSVNYIGSEQKFIFSKLDSSKIRHLLQKLMPDEKIITARGMSNDSIIEIFFQAPNLFWSLYRFKHKVCKYIRTTHWNSS